MREQPGNSGWPKAAGDKQSNAGYGQPGQKNGIAPVIEACAQFLLFYRAMNWMGVHFRRERLTPRTTEQMNSDKQHGKQKDAGRSCRQQLHRAPLAIKILGVTEKTHRHASYPQ